jgi:hypothetical protein
MKVHKTLLVLEQIVEHMTHAKAWLLANELEEFIETYKADRKDIILKTYYFGQHLNQIKAIDEQLEYLEKNLKTVRIALLAFETKFVEKRFALGDLQVFVLN